MEGFNFFLVTFIDSYVDSIPDETKVYFKAKPLIFSKMTYTLDVYYSNHRVMFLLRMCIIIKIATAPIYSNLNVMWKNF